MNHEKSLIRVLNGERLDPPPVWIMRQAGRYLPEYRALRLKAKDFLSFCYTPDLACEAVLQPLRRFDLDAAILFSDILVTPDALGRNVWFVEGEGPRLAPLADEQNWRIDVTDSFLQRLSPVYETVERLRAVLPRQTALIGFAGGPWTVATYMIQGEGGEKDRSRRAAYQRPADVDALLEVLVEATALHLAAQVAAGADCLQIFESWSEGLSEPLFERLIIAPTKALIARLRVAGVDAPIVGFPRGAGALLGRYARETGITALGVDTQNSGFIRTGRGARRHGLARQPRSPAPGLRRRGPGSRRAARGEGVRRIAAYLQSGTRHHAPGVAGTCDRHARSGSPIIRLDHDLA